MLWLLNIADRNALIGAVFKADAHLADKGRETFHGRHAPIGVSDRCAHISDIVRLDADLKLRAQGAEQIGFFQCYRDAVVKRNDRAIRRGCTNGSSVEGRSQRIARFRLDPLSERLRYDVEQAMEGQGGIWLAVVAGLNVPSDGFIAGYQGPWQMEAYKPIADASYR